MYLLRLKRKGDVYKDDDGVTGVLEFQNVLIAKNLGPAALKWVALIYDYDSPYRHFIESERVKAVSLDIYGNFEWEGKERKEIKAAIEKYKYLQFDPLDEQLLAFNRKIDQFTNFMNKMIITQDTAQDIQKIMIGIEKILKTRQTLLDAIEKRGERKKIVGDKGMSFLETKLDMEQNI
tara:strand:- start:4489 stop:5022 length:534 start_codon:yes stop_codon:yes gene_type:complete